MQKSVGDVFGGGPVTPGRQTAEVVLVEKGDVLILSC